MGRDFKTTAQAYQKFAQVLEDLEATKLLFESAGEPLPEQLKQFFGVRHSNGKPHEQMVSILPLVRASRPEHIEEGWISVEIGDVTATSLVLAVLRQAKGPVPAKDVIEQVTRINPHIPRGSINNIGTRLDRSLLHRTDEGWQLLNPGKAGIVCDGYLWGPQDIFDKTEIAAHRREAILQILKAFPSGLQTVQIVDQLRGTNWVHAPANKDLVKADMDLLEAHDRVRRISNSRKWCLNPVNRRPQESTGKH
ncbi:MAG: hypothetical protein WA639_22595 [Candidatus Acidiferrum sp.]